MDSYFKYLIIFVFTIFSFFYMNKVIELSKSNDIVLDKINEYASVFNYSCKEGYINENGIVIGTSGKNIDVSKSYNNMKGIGFRENLIEYKTISCITSKENNMDKYIVSGSPSKNSISLVINVNTMKYYSQMVDIFNKYNAEANILIDNNFNGDTSQVNILFKGKSVEELKEFNKKYDNFYCVKVNDYDLLNDCYELGINTIIMRDEIKSEQLLNVKKTLEKGSILFIRENEFNLHELSSTIKYIKSKGISIVSIDELLS